MTEDALPELRASDADRERTADLLRHAAGEGRLTMDELDERLSITYETRTQRELAKLTADVRFSNVSRVGPRSTSPTSCRGCGASCAPNPAT